MNNIKLELLGKKFPEEDLEWRIQQCGQGGSNYWALVVPYITNRAIMQRLDEACGLGGWKNEYQLSPCGTGYQCGISIKIDGEWVTRWDGSEFVGNGSIDKVKSTNSAAMKRTGVQWGIGRYLYQFDVGFAITQHCDNRKSVQDGFTFHENKAKKHIFQWKPPAVPSWALPVTESDVLKYIGAMEDSKSNNDLRRTYQEAYKLATAENDSKMLERFVVAKDSTKKAIEQQSIELIAQNEAQVSELVIKHVNMIQGASNQSAAKGLTEVAISEVKNIAKGTILKTAMQDIKNALIKSK